MCREHIDIRPHLFRISTSLIVQFEPIREPAGGQNPGQEEVSQGRNNFALCCGHKFGVEVAHFRSEPPSPIAAGEGLNYDSDS